MYWIHCQNGSERRINILDKILITGDISRGFAFVGSKIENGIRRCTFGIDWLVAA
jgi:hypothetical protein